MCEYTTSQHKVTHSPTAKARAKQRNIERDKAIWLEKKRASTTMAARMKAIGKIPRYFRMLWCADTIVSDVCETCETRYVVQVNFCRDRLCPICSWRRARALSRRLGILIALCEKEQHSCYILLTLTQKNVPWSELHPAIKRLMHAWDNMTRRFRRRKIITGWARTFETTRSKTYGDAHPHFHILMQVPPEYFDRKSEIYMGYKKDDLIKMWRECMGVDYDPSISIEGVKDYAMAGAVMETTKYLAKGSDLAGLPDEDFAHYVNAIHGVRAWSCGGRLKISDEEIERAFTHDESDEDHAGVCGNCGGKLHEMREVWDKTTQIYRMTVELDFKRLNQSETSEKKENHEGKSFQTIYNIHIDGDAFFGSGLDARRGTGD